MRLGLSYGPSSAQLKTVNAPPTPVSGVAHGASITLGEWQGVLPAVPRGDRPLPPTTSSHGARKIMHGNPWSRYQKTEGQVRLTAMQVIRCPKKKESTSRATIASSKKDNGARRSPTATCEESSKREQCCDAKEAAEALAS
ncbi:hypothetical protein KY284_006411 [Solanum tuberosum]|nr:hypothetical protein KY284_006411 [Solanum tuberosum]